MRATKRRDIRKREPSFPFRLELNKAKVTAKST
jgi:hypothetical protein